MLKKSIKIMVLAFIIIVLIIGISYPSYAESDNTDYIIIKTSEKSYNPLKKEATLTLVGDFLYEEAYYDALKKGDDIKHYFSKVRKYFENDDLSIGNMEVVITDGNMQISGSNYSFCAPLSVADEVSSLDMEVLGVANNHANDRGLAGRKSTVKFFKENSNILTIGTYENEKREVNKNIKEINGIKFGFLAYTYGTNKKIEKQERYTLGLFRDPDTKKLTNEYKNQISKEVSELRKMVDCLIVLTHWGYEFTYNISDEQRELAQLLNNLGVDIIVGAHSHNMQKIEWFNTDKHKTLIFYSMGNFVSADYTVPGASSEFIKSYQIGLMSKLKVSKRNGQIEIGGIQTEPIINYYDNNLRNFLLIPFGEYSKNYENTHYMYKNGFNSEFIETTYNKVIPREFRNRITN